MQLVTKSPLSFDWDLKESDEGDTRHVGKLSADFQFKAGQSVLTGKFVHTPCLDVRSADAFSYIAVLLWITTVEASEFTFQSSEISRRGDGPATARVRLSAEWYEPVQKTKRPHEIVYLNNATSLLQSRQLAEQQWMADLKGANHYLDALRSNYDPGLMAQMLKAVAEANKAYPVYLWFSRAERACNSLAHLLK